MRLRDARLEMSFVQFSMIVPVMAISNLVLTQQIYSEETNGAHEHNRDRVPLIVMKGIISCRLAER